MRLKKIVPVLSVRAVDGEINMFKIGNSYVMDIKIFDDDFLTNSFVVSVRGKKDLRKFARAILAEVGE